MPIRFSLTLFSLILCSLPLHADPFYQDPPEQAMTQQAVLSPEKSEKLPVDPHDCAQTVPLRSRQLTVPFEQLTLVGIVRFEQTPHALFIDQAQRMTALQLHDLLLPEGIQITQIQLKQVEYIDWSKSPNCHHPHSITLPL